MPVVLDTSALLASLYGEPGKLRVDAVLLGGEACWSAVNYAEFATKCCAGGMTADEVELIAAAYELRVVPFDAPLALATGALRNATRHLGLSLGDRACLALGQQLGATVLTADRAWSALEIGITIECIRP
ncbi:type II toxin-antitoxin system VapC family toxin [Polycyclovorans algicola]|uniref:type II toxin-antitoxin system VapC family toxin n=1 Tax=Polycyclovorans algicola TaxID=616992 RepID=UPI0004A73E24|nr:type II toxin-antitoxin system VapC family toxin [Polycyclovorans algicola]